MKKMLQEDVRKTLTERKETQKKQNKEKKFDLEKRHKPRLWRR